MRRCHGEARFKRLADFILEDRRRRFSGKPGERMKMSPEESDSEISSWPFPHVRQGFMKIKENEAPLHEHENTIESTELLLSYLVTPYCARITDMPVLMTLAHGDNITSHDLEVEAFNAIADPNKQLISVRGVDHMSLYTNREHLAKVADVQADWLESVLEQGV
jgi:fermentation-respiration switch protein FrsA (DUF1100 family)